MWQGSRVPDVTGLVDTTRPGLRPSDRYDGPRWNRPQRAIFTVVAARPLPGHSCALYDDELCFGVVAAWTNAGQAAHVRLRLRQLLLLLLLGVTSSPTTIQHANVTHRRITVLHVLS